MYLRAGVVSRRLYLTPKNNGNIDKKRKKNKGAVIPITPPALTDVLRVGLTLRYQKTNASDASVYTNCVGKLLCAATAGTTAFAIYEGIRLRRVTVRTAGVVNTGAGGFLIYNNAIALRLDDGAAAPFGQERRYTDVPTTTRGAVVSAKMQGLNSMWFDADAAASVTGQRLMLISGPIGTIVDVKCVLQLIINKSSALTALSGAGLTARILYFNYLDNTASAGAPTAGTQYLQNINGSNSTSFV